MKLQPIRSQKDLNDIFDINDQKIISLIKLKNKYKKRSIPKKSGGIRVITEPAPELKSFQKKLGSYIFRMKKLKFAYGGVKNKCREDVAKLHRCNYFILKCDIKNCFPSIRKKVVVKELLNFGFTYKYAKLFTEIITFEGSLPQGAPSSPGMANLILDKIDNQIITVLPFGCKYSRWIDDIMISFPKKNQLKIIKDISKKIENIIHSNGLNLKDGVSIILKEHCSDLLGQSISKKINIPKKWYKILRSQVYRLKRGFYKGKEQEKIIALIKGKMVLLKSVTVHHKKQTRYYTLKKILDKIM